MGSSKVSNGSTVSIDSIGKLLILSETFFLLTCQIVPDVLYLISRIILSLLCAKDIPGLCAPSMAEFFPLRLSAVLSVYGFKIDLDAS
jgi:hypothetical protein